MKRKLWTLLLALVLVLSALPVCASALTLPGFAGAVTNVGDASPSEMARKVADARKAELGIEKFDAIIYARSEQFADSMSAPYLAARKNAAILLQNSEDNQANIDYVLANLKEGGTFYELCWSDNVGKALYYEHGINIVGLCGMNRYQSSLKVLKEAGFDGGTVLVCDVYDFKAFSIAGATGLPIVLADQNGDSVHMPETENAVNYVILGKMMVRQGDEDVDLYDALAETLSASGTVERLPGSTSLELSRMVAERFFGGATEAVLADTEAFQNPLVAAPLAYAKKAPLILVDAGEETAAKEYLESLEIGDVTIVGEVPTVHVHTEVVTPAVEPDCEYYGWTEGKHCAECGEVLVAPTKVPELGHDFTSGFYCSRCGIADIPEEELKYGDVWKLNKGVLYCSPDANEDGEVPAGFFEEISRYMDRIKAIVYTFYIRDDVYTIPENAFAGAKNLTKVTITGGETEREGTVTIGAGAFAGAENLTTVTISGGRNSVNISIGAGAFAGTKNLTEITFAGSSVSTVSVGAGAFAGAEQLQELVVNIGSVKAAEDAFAGTNLREIRIIAGGIDFKGFGVVPTLEKFTVQEGNRSYSTDDNGALYNADKTALLAVPQASYGDRYVIRDGVQKVDTAFYGHTKLKDVVIPESVTELYYAFGGCTGLTEIKFPKSISSIGKGAFEGCTGLTALNFPENIESIGAYAFKGCTGLTALDIPDWMIGRDIPAGFGTAYVSSIGMEAFAGCTGLTNVSFPDNLRGFGIWAFKGCTGLTEVKLPSALKELGIAFDDCCNLKEIHLPGAVTTLYGDTVLSAPYAGQHPFNGCTSLERVTVAPENTAFWADEHGALYSADKTDLIFLPQGYRGAYGIPDGITDIRNVFRGCSGLTGVTIPDSVTDIAGAFTGCSGLTSLTIPTSVTNVSEGFGVNPTFAGCASLKELQIPYGETELAAGTFRGCTSLVKLELPDSLESIGERCFDGCTSLTELTIPKNVTQVGYLGSLNEEGTAVAPSALKKITFMGNEPEFKSATLNGKSLPVFEGITAEVLVSKGDPTWADSVAENKQYGGNVTWMQKEMCETHNVVDGACTNCTALFGGQFKNNLSWKLEGTRLTISGSGEMGYDISNCWQGWLSDITEVVIEDGVLSIAYRAFANMTALRSITIADSVQKIHAYSFYNTGLTEIELPKALCMIEAPFGGWYEWYDDDWNLIEETRKDDRKTSVSEIRFTGDAPVFEYCERNHTEPQMGGEYHKPIYCIHGDVFETLTLTAYYPEGNPTWTEEVRKDYGGTITWVAYDPDAHFHSFGPWTVTKEASCDAPGQQQRSCACGEVETEAIPALDHIFVDSICTLCGAPKPTAPDRIAGGNRISTALTTSDKLKQVLGVEKYATIVVADAMSFPDALSGSYLAAATKAPILLYKEGQASVVQYVRDNLADGGKVYVLGGTSSVPDSLMTELSGIDCERVAGSGRLATSLKIIAKADELRGTKPEKVLICDGRGFADSLSASATGLPILLVNGGGSLNDEQKAYLESVRGAELYVIGGKNSVSEDILNSLTAYDADGAERVFGSGRELTSVEVAKKFFPEAKAAALASSLDFPDGLSGGPVAYAMNMPLLLTRENKEAITGAYVAERGITEAYIIGGKNAVPDDTADKVFGK
ncbi:MAG: leucine-rich repeat protein [Oscillospiraceae bacterium]|nr:leucine-rich repeat protein [Oscillospiraceae bacterium]